MSAITAITAQNTLGVSAVHPVPSTVILAQVRAVVGDIGVDAVKVGMLATAEIVHAVSQALEELPVGTPVVVDPVMVAESGARLLDPDAEGALIAEILPRATILTPNMSEARALARHAYDEGKVKARVESKSGTNAHERESAHASDVGSAYAEDEAEAQQLIRAVHTLGSRIVLLTGGHRAQAVDLFLDSEAPGQLTSIPGERHPDGAAHGSGCTHSSVLAAQLAIGRAPLQAAYAARAITGAAVAEGLRDVGEGPGPVDVIGLARMRRL